jgi:hypothetical protein
MSARVLLHPAVPPHKRADLVRDLRLLGVEPDNAPLPIGFTCDRCAWAGSEPAWRSMSEYLELPLGDLPCCPACGSYALTFRSAKEVPWPPP